MAKTVRAIRTTMKEQPDGRWNLTIDDTTVKPIIHMGGLYQSKAGAIKAVVAYLNRAVEPVETTDG